MLVLARIGSRTGTVGSWDVFRFNATRKPNPVLPLKFVCRLVHQAHSKALLGIFRVSHGSCDIRALHFIKIVTP